jgi:hypothetical protein
MFALRVNLSYQHIKMGVASLSRETRPFVLRVILTINKSQRSGDLFSFSFKGSKGFPVYRKRRRQLPTTCYLCYQHVIPPYRPSVFTIFPKKKRDPSVSKVCVVLGHESRCIHIVTFYPTYIRT